jgi:hypothetical protein
VNAASNSTEGGNAAKSILPWLGGIAFVLFIAAILFPVFAKAKGGSLRQPCMGHLKQMVNASILYMADYDDYLPLAADWMDELQLSRQVPEAYFHDWQGIKPGEYGYAFRGKASAKASSEFKNPTMYALIFDSMLTGRNAHGEPNTLPHPGRHSGCDNVAFFDGHVKRIPMP